MIEIDEIYTPIIKRVEPTIILITGGRNSGKSFAVSFLQCVRADNIQTKCMFSRYTMVNAELSVIPSVLSRAQIVSDNFFVKYNILFNKKTGSEIHFKGIKTSSGNQTAALKGLEDFDTWIIDEADEITNENDFDKIINTLRSNRRKNKVILISNNLLKTHFFYKRWFQKPRIQMIDGVPVEISTHQEILHIHTTYLNNLKNIPEDYLNRIIQTRQENFKKYSDIYIGATKNANDGNVFENIYKIPAEEFEAQTKSAKKIYGLDFGYSNDPSVLVECTIIDKVLFVKQLIYENKLDDFQISKRLEKLCDEEFPIVCDWGGGGDVRIANIARLTNLKFESADKPAGSVESGVKLLTSFEKIYLCGEDLFFEFAEYGYKDNKLSEYNNHTIDATRYAISAAIKYGYFTM